MLLKKISTFFAFVLLANFVFAQKFSFTVEANSNYSFLSADFIEPEPISGPVGFTYVSITTPGLIKMNQNGKFGSGISGKFGVAVTERLTYRMGVGVVMRRNTFNLQSFNIGLNGFTTQNPDVVIFEGVQPSTDTISSLSEYYSQYGTFYTSTNSRNNNKYTNTFWQFNLIPIELDYQLIKDKLSIYGNFAVQPVFLVGGEWGHRAALDSKDDVFNDVQMGAEMGFQFQIFKSWAVRGSYFRGLTNVYKGTRYDTKWNSIALGVVYRIK